MCSTVIFFTFLLYNTCSGTPSDSAKSGSESGEKCLDSDPDSGESELKYCVCIAQCSFSLLVVSRQLFFVYFRSIYVLRLNGISWYYCNNLRVACFNFLIFSLEIQLITYPNRPGPTPISSALLLNRGR
jgi:hypothetical protein